MCRVGLLFVLAAIAVLGQEIPSSTRDEYPFDEWLKGKDNGHIHWAMRVLPPSLSLYQRLDLSIWIDVNASEFVKRPKPGQIRFLLEIRDRDRVTYRKHQSFVLKKQQNPSDLSRLRFREHACINPGDYEVTGIVYDADSKEHVVKREKLHVPGIHHDALRAAWDGVPNVEFSSCSPANSSPLSLALKTEKPVRIEVVVNTAVNRNKIGASALPLVSKLISWLQVISELRVENGSMNVTVLDLERRKIAFTQDNVDRLNLRGITASLRENNPYKVDIHALENYLDDVQFFVAQIQRVLERNQSSEGERVLIVLSGPRTFPRGEDMRSIEEIPDPDRRVFYIRVHNVSFDTSNSDSLEHTLRPLHPRLFDVMTAEEFRRALGSIIKEVSQDVY